jgi:hypothetical protein
MVERNNIIGILGKHVEQSQIDELKGIETFKVKLNGECKHVTWYCGGYVVVINLKGNHRVMKELIDLFFPGLYKSVAEIILHVEKGFVHTEVRTVPQLLRG